MEQKSLEIYLHKFSQLYFDNGANVIAMDKEQSLKWCWNNWNAI